MMLQHTPNNGKTPGNPFGNPAGDPPRWGPPPFPSPLSATWCPPTWLTPAPLLHCTRTLPPPYTYLSPTVYMPNNGKPLPFPRRPSPNNGIPAGNPSPHPLRSYLVSADMAHALHPNYQDRHDAALGPKVHGGMVIKHNANQRYATNAVTAFFFREMGSRAGLCTQEFAVRWEAGGQVGGGSSIWYD